MANLAIKGHPNRGKEVIEILEMLGGKNKISTDGTKTFNGTNVYLYYTIEEDNYIHIRLDSRKGDYIKFNLEEFLEKFPYKVGDKVIDINGFHGTIAKMSWDEDNATVLYTFKCDEVGTNRCGYTATMLKPYKKEISGVIIDRFICLEGFELYDDKGNIIDTKEITMKKKKPQYPKTYEQCCDLLGKTKAYQSVSGYKTELLEDFQKLLICRDAYWKIAGEQMGLGKPWKPRWNDNYQKKWLINFYQDEINLTTGPNVHFVLVFPTKEMRDAFYDNFKDLIEECEELL